MSSRIPKSKLIRSIFFWTKRQKCNENKGAGEKEKNLIALPEIYRFTTECLEAVSVKREHADITATALIDADIKGFHSHGLIRLENYIKDIKEKLCDANAVPTIATECASVAAVRGHNGLGMVIGTFCMDLAIQKATETGIGMVVANGSNHFGINSFYTCRACKKGLIGISVTNTSPLMVPTGAKAVALGTHPLSVAAPAECDDNVVMDFATTAVSVGKIDYFRRLKKKIPLTWALDDTGKPTDNPEIAIKNRKLMPLGGDVSYKGTSLALMVECLSGLLADSAFGPFIRTWGAKPAKPANLGHGFIAIDPSKFQPGFGERLSKLLNYIRCLEPADPKAPVLIPGDIERVNIAKVNKQGGIIYTDPHMKIFKSVAEDLGIKHVQTKG